MAAADMLWRSDGDDADERQRGERHQEADVTVVLVLLHEHIHPENHMTSFC